LSIVNVGASPSLISYDGQHHFHQYTHSFVSMCSVVTHTDAFGGTISVSGSKSSANCDAAIAAATDEGLAVGDTAPPAAVVRRGDANVSLVDGPLVAAIDCRGYSDKHTIINTTWYGMVEQ
jgi:hypothetical protein